MDNSWRVEKFTLGFVIRFRSGKYLGPRAGEPTIFYDALGLEKAMQFWAVHEPEILEVKIVGNGTCSLEEVKEKLAEFKESRS